MEADLRQEPVRVKVSVVEAHQDQAMEMAQVTLVMGLPQQMVKDKATRVQVMVEMHKEPEMGTVQLILVRGDLLQETGEVKAQRILAVVEVLKETEMELARVALAVDKLQWEVKAKGQLILLIMVVQQGQAMEVVALVMDLLKQAEVAQDHHKLVPEELDQDKAAEMAKLPHKDHQEVKLLE